MRVKKVKNIPLPTNFGENLRFLRLLHGLSQERLAQMLSIRRNNIASYESRLVEPRASVFLSICDHFQVDPRLMLESLLAENLTSEQPNVVENELSVYVTEQLDRFTLHNTELMKILEGYKAYIDMREESSETRPSVGISNPLNHFVDVLEMMIQNNWKLIRSVIDVDTNNAKNQTTSSSNLP